MEIEGPKTATEIREQEAAYWAAHPRGMEHDFLEPIMDKIAELIKQHGSIEGYCAYITDGQTDRRP